jgi:hypothetical protein
LDPDLFRHLNLRIGISQQMLQQVTLGGAMIVLPLFLQIALEYNAMGAGLSLAPLSLSMFGMAMLAGRRAGRWRPINAHARNLSLQIALLIPALAALLGLAHSLRMLRLPDVRPQAVIDGVGLG